MLRNICFLLKKETEEKLQGMFGPLLDDLAAHGVTVSGLQESEKRAEDVKCRQAAMLTAHGNEREETLYITDQGKVYDSLRIDGRYVLPFLHDAKGEERYPNARCAVERLEETTFDSLEMLYRRLAGLPWEIFETDRLLVRETTVEDVDCFYEIYAEPSITAYMEALCEDKDEEIAYIETYIEKIYAFYGFGMWTVIEKQSEKVIGRAGVSWREGYDLPEIGFVIGVPWQGKGYAYEVCKAILDYTRKELEMTKVLALIRPGNERSVRLCEKLGFVPDGRTKENGITYQIFVKEL